MTTTSMCKRTVVFDIDGTLCEDVCISFHHRMLLKNNPTLEDIDSYAFHANWKILFDYLISQNCLIMIYSAGGEGRNVPLMKSFLLSKYGELNYNDLCNKGQFKIFSGNHLVDTFKLLAPLLQEGQTIDDIIIIDDMDDYPSPTEPEFINVKVNFQKNIVNGLLGLFMTYFEDHQETTSLRKFVGAVMPYNAERNRNLRVYDENRFIAKGLREIRKTDPDALYYAMDNRHIPLEFIPSIEWINSNCSAESTKSNFFKNYCRFHYEPYYLDYKNTAKKPRIE